MQTCISTSLPFSTFLMLDSLFASCFSLSLSLSHSVSLSLSHYHLNNIHGFEFQRPWSSLDPPGNWPLLTPESEHTEVHDYKPIHLSHKLTTQAAISCVLMCKRLQNPFTLVGKCIQFTQKEIIMLFISRMPYLDVNNRALFCLPWCLPLLVLFCVQLVLDILPIYFACISLVLWCRNTLADTSMTG